MAPETPPTPQPPSPLQTDALAHSHPGVLDNDSQPALTNLIVQNQCFLVQAESRPWFRGQAGLRPRRQAPEKETDETGMSPQGGVSQGHPGFLPSRGVGGEGGPEMGIKGVWVTCRIKRLDPEGGEGQKVSHPNEETASSKGPRFPWRVQLYLRRQTFRV